MPMMLHLKFDEIESASNAELLRLYRLTLFKNENGRFDQRLERIIAEIQRRTAANLTTCDAFVHIEAHL